LYDFCWENGSPDGREIQAGLTDRIVYQRLGDGFLVYMTYNLTPWPLVRKRTIPTERSPLVGEVSAITYDRKISILALPRSYVPASISKLISNIYLIFLTKCSEPISIDVFWKWTEILTL
jgi:hypothetical protein